MITVCFEKRGKSGLCEFLYDSIKSQILDGTLKANEKLPSKRNLSSNLGVSVITVQNAYSQLASEGYIFSIEKKGFFVTDLNISESEKEALSKKDFFPDDYENQEKDEKEKKYFADFSSNSTAYEKFPFNLWSKVSRKVLNSERESLLERVEVKGVFELRKALSKYLKEFRNMKVSPNQIIIGSGTESLYTMVVQFLGRKMRYAVENPGYKKVSKVFQLNKADVFPVLIDSNGIDSASLEKIGANVVHISPSHHFPTGIVMPVKRRQELLSWAQKENHYIIEDDYDSEFRFIGKPLNTLQSEDKNGSVIYINTFSKTLSPSFRISFMVLPEKLLHTFEEKFNFFTSGVSSFEQFTLASFINEGFFAKHIIRMKNYYKNLRNLLIENLEKSSIFNRIKIQEQESGLHFLMQIDSKKNVEKISDELKEKGVNIPLLKDYYYNDAPSEKNSVFVVNYSGIKKEDISKIVKILEEVI